MTSQPFVSVVTPFYNTSDYLRECIESVLAQTYENFEYLLVDNQSTDGSAEIAREYAERDPRIRVSRNAEFVDQVPNYNGAVRQVSPAARYVKIVQADDCILPECLEKMVAVAEAHPSVAIVSSYYLMGRNVFGIGIEWPRECIPGRVASRLHLIENRFLFGTPTTLLYRADLVAKRKPFYSEISLHEDTELCHEVLADSDFGFVHQVLSYTRVGNGGILNAIETFHWQLLDFYVILKKYGRKFLSPRELEDRTRAVRADYLQILGESALLRREPAFWQYHERGLATVGEVLPSGISLAPHVARAALKAVTKPRWLLRERERVRSGRNGTAAISQAAAGGAS
jgi:glycosyltransferase involved in cell wall biosynthesis